MAPRIRACSTTTSTVARRFITTRTARAPHALSGDDPASELKTRALPGPGWHQEPRIPLAGRARISRVIGVTQTGAGNRARLLRVAGDDETGKRGVWEKTLDEQSWRFRAAAVPIDDAAWLVPGASAAIAPPALSMAGRVRGPASLGWVPARTDDFWFHCSPFALTLTFDGEDVPLVVHTVDAWTLYTQDNAADTQAYKALKATVLLADDARPSTRARARLEELLGAEPRAPFQFVVVANREEIVLAPVTGRGVTGRSRSEIVLRRDPRLRARATAPTSLATTTAQRFVDLARVHAGGCAQDAGLRADAARALEAVRAERLEITRRVQISAALEHGISFAIVPVDVLTILTTARFTLPLTTWWTGFEAHAPAVLAAQSMSWQRTEGSARDDFASTEAALRSCVR